MPVGGHLVPPARPATVQFRRDEIDAALVFDRAATRSLQLSADRLTAATDQYELWAGQDWGALDLRMAQRAVDRATEAHSFAVSYQQRCRAALGVILDRISSAAEHLFTAEDAATAPSRVASGSAELPAAAAEPVIAPPTAVDPDGGGIYAATVLAARLADAAASLAMATVSRAADDAQQAVSSADGLAADAVALTAARAATDVQRRADHLAKEAATKAAQAIARVSAAAGVHSPRTTRLILQVSATAEIRARETVLAATIVSRATAMAAAAVAARCAAEAAATRLEVSRAAAGVRTVAAATADAVADIALGAEVLAHDLAMARRG